MPQRVRVPSVTCIPGRTDCHSESRTFEVVRKMGGSFHLKLNIDSRPIANKYREGKVKRTLKRELKVPEIAEGKAFGTSCWRAAVRPIALPQRKRASNKGLVICAP